MQIHCQVYRRPHSYVSKMDNYLQSWHFQGPLEYLELQLLMFRRQALHDHQLGYFENRDSNFCTDPSVGKTGAISFFFWQPEVLCNLFAKSWCLYMLVSHRRMMQMMQPLLHGWQQHAPGRLERRCNHYKYCFLLLTSTELYRHLNWIGNLLMCKQRWKIISEQPGVAVWKCVVLSCEVN